MVTKDKRESEGQSAAFNFSLGIFNVSVDPNKCCSDFIIKDRSDDGGTILQSLSEQQNNLQISHELKRSQSSTFYRTLYYVRRQFCCR